MCRRSVLCLTVVAVAACGGEDDSSDVSCHISRSGCQRQLFDDVRQLRGGNDGNLPDFRVISVDEFRGELLAAQDKDDKSETCMDRALRRSLQSLDLVPVDQTLGDAAVSVALQTIAAFYSPEDDLVTVIERQERDPVAATAVMAHELVHALQQREGLFDGFPEGDPADSDGTMAYESLVEGEATFVELAVIPYRAHRALEVIPWETIFERMLVAVQGEIERSSAPLTYAQSSFRYAVGSHYFGRHYLDGGMTNSSNLLESWPRSTLPMVAENAGRSPAVVEPLRCGRPVPPSGYQVVADDRLGPVLAYVFLQRVLGIEDAWVLALQWRDDRLVVYLGPEEKVALTWRVRFADSEAASLFSERLAAAATERDNWYGERAGALEVLLAASFSGDPRDLWPTANTICGDGDPPLNRQPKAEQVCPGPPTASHRLGLGRRLLGPLDRALP